MLQKPQLLCELWARLRRPGRILRLIERWRLYSRALHTNENHSTCKLLILENTMLELRPNCECCSRDLPPDSTDTVICTYECTFCVACAEHVLSGICPNCGGNLVPRPIRPPAMLLKNPASTKRVVKSEGCHGQSHDGKVSRSVTDLPTNDRSKLPRNSSRESSEQHQP